MPYNVWLIGNGTTPSAILDRRRRSTTRSKERALHKPKGLLAGTGRSSNATTRLFTDAIVSGSQELPTAVRAVHFL